MRIFIRHRIEYRYRTPVFLEPHLIRMRPRSDVRQYLVSYGLTVTPEPTGRSACVDLSGGSGEICWFDGLTTSLTVEGRMLVETTTANPFDFVLPEARYARLPLSLPEAEQREAQPALVVAPLGGVAASLVAHAREEVEDDLLRFPAALAATIANRVVQQERKEPGLLDFEEMLTAGRGACRDVATLFVVGCRSVGIPARFVSGYHFAETESGRHELHSWGEVYLPGGGWRPYDPSLGVACSSDHVALTSATDIDLTTPVSGSVRGDDPGDMLYEVNVRAE